MNEALAGRGGFNRADGGAQTLTYEPIPEVDYFAASESSSPIFDRTWTEYVAQHPELASIDIDSAQADEELYTPIEGRSDQTLDEWLDENRSLPRIEALLGEKLPSQDEFIQEGLGAGEPEVQPEASEKLDFSKLTRRKRVVGSAAVMAVLGKEESRTRQFINRFKANRAAAKEVRAERKEARRGRGKALAIGALATAAVVTVAAVGATTARHWNGASSHSESRVVQTTEPTVTPQPTAEAVKPKNKNGTDKKEASTTKEVKYTLKDGKGIWHGVESALPKDERTESKINEIKNDVLEDYDLTEAEAERLPNGYEVVIKIPRNR